MEILSNFQILTQCAADMRTLSEEKLNIDDPLNESLGKVRDREEELLLLLREIGKDLAELFRISALLLDDIAGSFREADRSSSKGFQ